MESDSEERDTVLADIQKGGLGIYSLYMVL